MTAAAAESRTPFPKRKRGKKRRHVREDRELFNILEKLKEDMAFLYNNFDNVTDPVLIDGYIYEILSLQMKYKYYLRLCKSLGLQAH